MKRVDHEIVQQVLDGEVSKEVFEGFQERMRDESELVRLYGEYANLHHSLLEEYEESPIPDSPVVSAKGWSLGKILGLVVAALSVAVFLFYQWQPSSLAEVKFTQDAVWRVDGNSRAHGDFTSLAKGGTLQLEYGHAELRFANAVTVLLEGPATLTLVSASALRLDKGRGRFIRQQTGGTLDVITPSMTVEDLGTDFGIDISPDHSEELHVFGGKVKVRVNGHTNGEVLIAGEAGRPQGSDPVERIQADETRFPSKLMEFIPIISGHFVKSDWRLDYGHPIFTEDRVDGENYSLFLKLPEATRASSVMLATLKVENPTSGQFHTDGWAGMSIYGNGKELLFFGDSYGPEKTWSLDLKQRFPVTLPAVPLSGPRTVTLRYDGRTGNVSLHQGGIPLGPAFCTGKIPAGSTFDEIRIGASSNASLAVSGLTIRLGDQGRRD